METTIFINILKQFCPTSACPEFLVGCRLDRELFTLSIYITSHVFVIYHLILAVLYWEIQDPPVRGINSWLGLYPKIYLRQNTRWVGTS